MPTYQYACTACGHRFEAVQAFTDASLSECPQCSGKLRKLFGSVGVVFKGSGFYRTDSRADAKGDAKGKEKTDATASAKGDTSSAASSSSSSSDKGSAAASSTSTTSSSSSSSSSSGTTAKAS